MNEIEVLRAARASLARIEKTEAAMTKNEAAEEIVLLESYNELSSVSIEMNLKEQYAKIALKTARGKVWLKTDKNGDGLYTVDNNDSVFEIVHPREFTLNDLKKQGYKAEFEKKARERVRFKMQAIAERFRELTAS